jgi:hypothetical protein
MMQKLKGLLFRWPPEKLVRVACYIGIVALGFMVWSALVPAALPVVIGMSVGQGLGVLAMLCYGVAVISDTARSRRASMRPPPPPETSDEASS